MKSSLIFHLRAAIWTGFEICWFILRILKQIINVLKQWNSITFNQIYFWLRRKFEETATNCIQSNNGLLRNKERQISIHEEKLFFFDLSRSQELTPRLSSVASPFVEGWYVRSEIKFKSNSSAFIVITYGVVKCTIKIKFRITFALEVNRAWEGGDALKAFLAGS